MEPGHRLIAASANLANGGLSVLANDVLCFLGSTVVVIPLFKQLRLSPVLGFLAAGVLLNQLGLTRDIKDLELLSELGVLFLLFEMGLELSLDRLKALAKYAFGMGTLQMVLCTGIFTLAGLPLGHGLVTQFLETFGHASHRLVTIRSIDEAVVIGAALSLSSSAFVLQLLAERGEMATRFGSATLGILLLQDIAVVPFLVLLPLIEQGDLMEGATPVSLISVFLPTALKTVAGLGLTLVGGRVVLRRIFEVVANSRNREAFLALTLLTVAGAAYTTGEMGLSDTMGAFLAGVLLSETNYKTQIEADIKPFRGLLLGLFFTTTGASIDLQVLTEKWLTISWLLAGLLTTKTAVIATIGRGFGLSSNESLRIGFMLSQGGEFAFVLLSLAAQLKVLPADLNQVLIIVVVLSMALTPGLAELGKVAADWLDSVYFSKRGPQAKLTAEVSDNSQIHEASLEEPIVICGFGPQSQMLVNMLENPMVPSRPSYVVFDLDPARVQAARHSGFPVIFGDGSREVVLQAAGVKRPRAFVVCHRNSEQALRAVEQLHSSYPTVPVYACGADPRHAAQLQESGAFSTVATQAEAGLSLGCRLLSAELGMSSSEVAFLKQSIDDAMGARTRALSSALSAGYDLPPVSTDIIVLDTALHKTMATVDMGEDSDLSGYSDSDSDSEWRAGDDDLDQPSSLSADAEARSASGLGAGAGETHTENGGGLRPARPGGMVMAASATIMETDPLDEPHEVATILSSPPNSCPIMVNAELPSDMLSSRDDAHDDSKSQEQNVQTGLVSGRHQDRQ